MADLVGRSIVGDLLDGLAAPKLATRVVSFEILTGLHLGADGWREVADAGRATLPDDLEDRVYGPRILVAGVGTPIDYVDAPAKRIAYSQVRTGLAAALSKKLAALKDPHPNVVQRLFDNATYDGDVRAARLVAGYTGDVLSRYGDEFDVVDDSLVPIDVRVLLAIGALKAGRVINPLGGHWKPTDELHLASLSTAQWMVRKRVEELGLGDLDRTRFDDVSAADVAVSMNVVREFEAAAEQPGWEPVEPTTAVVAVAPAIERDDADGVRNVVDHALDHPDRTPPMSDPELRRLIHYVVHTPHVAAGLQAGVTELLVRRGVGRAPDQTINPGAEVTTPTASDVIIGATDLGRAVGDVRADLAAARPTPHPRLDAPASVAPGDDFIITVGLQADRDPHVTGSFTPPEGVDQYSLGIDIKLEGLSFVNRADSTLTFEVVVGEELPSADVMLRVPADQSAAAGRVTLDLYADGQPAGSAYRTIPIGDADPTLRSLGPPMRRPSETSTEKLDLTIDVEVLDAMRLLWRVHSPHTDRVVEGEWEGKLESPEDLQRKYLGMFSSDEFVGVPDFELMLAGTLKQLGRLIPPSVWRAVRAVIDVAKEEDRYPNVLLRTDDQYVPWEMAIHPIEAKWLGAARDAGLGRLQTLGALVNLGRSQRTDSSFDDGIAPPEGAVPELRTSKRVSELTIIRPDYSKSEDLQPLPHAAIEAQKIAEAYPFAREIKPNAYRAAVVALVEDMLTSERPDAIHVSAHGAQWAPTDETGFVLTDESGATYVFTSAYPQPELKPSPFVFINACRIGTSASRGAPVQLGLAFLNAGASAVLQPFWDVDSHTAMTVARDLYTRIFDQQQSVGRALREVRATASCVLARGASASASGRAKAALSVLGYNYLGDPRLHLVPA